MNYNFSLVRVSNVISFDNTELASSCNCVNPTWPSSLLIDKHRHKALRHHVRSSLHTRPTVLANIAKGTTDPRVEFILPEGWVHLAKVPSWGRITSSTAVMWTRTGNLTNYTSKNPLQVASGPHPLRRARGLSKELVPNVQLWMKHQALPSHTRPIKFTKQEWVSEWVTQLLTRVNNDQTRVR